MTSRQLVAGLLVVTTVLAAGAATAIDLGGGPWRGESAGAVNGAAYAAVAALILVRRPGHPMGWILAAIGLVSATGFLADLYQHQGTGTDLRIWAGWYAHWFWLPMVSLTYAVLPLTFPTGRPASPLWRPVLWIIVSSTTFGVLAAMFQRELALRGPEGERIGVLPNPLGWAPWADMEYAWPMAVLLVTLGPCIVASLASLVIRFRRAGPVERQQVKWVAFGLGTLIVFFFGGNLGETLFGARLPGELLLPLIVPACLGIAILRYRLYDIDRIISRAVAYVLIVAALAALYAGLVVGLQQLTRPLAGGGDLAVAASTLAVAAVFGPLRRRVRNLVDRRFNRARYNAQQIADRFASHLRDAVELEDLMAGLGGVVQQTIQPSQLSIWVRPIEQNRNVPVTEHR